MLSKRSMSIGGLVLGAMLLVAGAAALVAQEQGAGRGGRMHRMGPGFGPGFGPGPLAELHLGLRQLNVTDEQRSQIRTILEGHRDELRALLDRGRSAHQQLVAAIEAPASDEGAIRAASAGVAEVQADAAVLRAKVRSEVFAVLTPEQRQKATALATEKRQRMRQRMEGFRERMGI